MIFMNYPEKTATIWILYLKITRILSFPLKSSLFL